MFVKVFVALHFLIIIQSSILLLVVLIPLLCSMAFCRFAVIVLSDVEDVKYVLITSF